MIVLATALGAAEVLVPYFAGAEEECVAVLHLDQEARLVATTFTRPGGAEEVDLPVREILGAALRSGASAIIVAHNHPSGDPRPSEADDQATRLLADGARALGIRLLDHMVFAGADWRSFRELGLL